MRELQEWLSLGSNQWPSTQGSNWTSNVIYNLKCSHAFFTADTQSDIQTQWNYPIKKSLHIFRPHLPNHPSERVKMFIPFQDICIKYSYLFVCSYPRAFSVDWLLVGTLKYRYKHSSRRAIITLRDHHKFLIEFKNSTWTGTSSDAPMTGQKTKRNKKSTSECYPNILI